MELLFCANCRVSIPQGDAQSGRAHREFGSLLCAGCSKADPGERAARREAVEAEMAADVDAQDPVVARRCSVCSAAVPYGQIVTGKAKIDGNRVVCERCRAVSAASPAAATRSESSGTSGFVVAVVVLAAIGIGFLAARAWTVSNKNAESTAVALSEMRDLRSESARQMKQLDDKLAAAERRSGQPDESAASERRAMAADVANLRQALTNLTAETSKADADLAQRLARLEGEISGLKERIRDLASRAPAPAVAPPVVVERAPETTPVAPAAGPPKPDVVSPEIVKLCKDLLESADDGVAFNAATELTRLKDPWSIPSLVKALAEHKHYFVRRGCARALKEIKAWLAVPALIKALEDREVYVALEANRTLAVITGNDFGVTQDSSPGQRKTKAAAAEKWWDKNKDKPPEGVSLHPITN